MSKKPKGEDDDKPKTLPPALAEIEDVKRQVAATLKRAKPAPISKSLRLQIVGLLGHAMKQRLHGDEVIWPGAKMMMTWGKCCDRTARTGFSKLRNWEVLEPVEYATGGRRRVRYRFHYDALYRAMVLQKCNPSLELRQKLVGNPAISAYKSELNQGDDAKLSKTENPAISADANAARNPAKLQACSIENNTRRSSPLAGVAEAGVAVAPFPHAAHKAANGQREAAMSSQPAHQVVRSKFAENMGDAEAPRPDDGRNAGYAPLKEKKDRQRGLWPSVPSDRVAPEQACGNLGAHTRRQPLSDPREAMPEADLSADAQAVLRLILATGPTTDGAAATDLGWGATRAWLACEELVRTSICEWNKFGRLAAKT